MADSKFREFGSGDRDKKSTTPTSSVSGTAPIPSRFREFGDTSLTGLTNPTQRVDIGPELEGKFQKEEGSILKTGANALPVIGGIAGTPFGPGGTAIGSGLGAGLNTFIQGGSNIDALRDAIITGGAAYGGAKMTGGMPGIIGPAAVNTLLNKGASEANKGLYELQHPETKSQPEESFGSQTIDLLADFGLNLAGNVAGQKISNRINKRGELPPERLESVAGQTREQIVSPGPPKAEGIPSKSTVEYGKGAQKAIRGHLGQAEAIEKKAWDTFRDTHVKPNTETVPKLVGFEEGNINDIDPNTGQARLVPKIEHVEVKGPIYTPNTLQLAGKVLPKLDEFMKGETFQQLPPMMQTKYAKLYATMKDLATPFESGDKNGHPVQIPVKEWETLKDVRTDINRLVSGKPTPNFPEAQLKKIAESLGEDIDLSIATLWKNGPAAERALAVANKATEFKKSTFTKEIDRKLYGTYERGQLDKRLEGDPSRVFKDAYKSPEKAERLMKAMGKGNESYIKGDYFDNVLMDKGFGQNYSKFNPQNIIDDLENPNSVSRVILNADERNNVLRFARASKTMGEANSNTSLNFINGKFVINLGIAATKAISGINLPARVAISGIQLMEAVKDSKTLTDIASRLIKIRPDSAEAQAASKLLLRGLRGIEVSLGVGTEERRATISDNGSIKILEDIANK